MINVEVLSEDTKWSKKIKKKKDFFQLVFKAIPKKKKFKNKKRKKKKKIFFNSFVRHFQKDINLLIKECP